MVEPSANESPSHQLCAILFADMVGYSSMPEAEALECKEQMLELARTGLLAHGGRLVKTMGDGFLAQFPAANPAVAFAVELQEKVAQRNASLPARSRFLVRVGIHAGDVIVRDGDVEGVTVNIAARTESLAAPGGICLTAKVWEQVPEAAARRADNLGRWRVKGIRSPICFYHFHAPNAGWAARARLRARLLLKWPGRLPAAIVTAGILIAVGLWIRPFGMEVLAKIFPLTPFQQIQRTRKQLERYDLPDRVEQARESLVRILPKDPRDPLFNEAHALLSFTYWRRYRQTLDEEDRSEAFRRASMVLSNAPNSKMAAFILGVVAADEGRWRDATNHLIRASEASKWEDGEALVELAAACRRLQDAASADSFEQKALRVKNKSWSYHNALGRYRWTFGDARAAVASFDEALKLAPDSPTALLNMGLVLEAQGQSRPAFSYLQKSLEIWPTAAAHIGMGHHYNSEEKWLAAATNFVFAARKNPARHDASGNAGLAFLKVAGHENEARESLEEAIDKARSTLKKAWNPIAAANVGLYQAALQRDEEACETFAEVWRQSHDHQQVHANIIEAVRLMKARGGHAQADRLQRMLDEKPKPSNSSIQK